MTACQKCHQKYNMIASVMVMKCGICRSNPVREAEIDIPAVKQHIANM